MKLLTGSCLILIILSSAFAAVEVPKELRKLLPAGTSSIQMKGIGSDGRNCAVNLSSNSLGFEAIAFNFDNNEPTNMLRFKLGLGGELSSFKVGNEVITAEALFTPNDQYSSKTKSNLMVELLNGRIHKIAVTEQKKGLVSWGKSKTVTCLF
jgi:hypothetical protein